MFRYVGLIWDSQNPIATKTAREFERRIHSSSDLWVTPFSRPGMIVMTRGRNSLRDVVPFSNGHGVVVGTLFRWPHHGMPESLSPMRSLDAPSDDQVVSSGARHLVSAFWGSYIAFVCSSDAQTKWVLHSPCADLPCYETVIRDVHVFFSYLPDCLLTSEFVTEVDWDYISLHMLSAVRSTATALKGVSAISCGMCAVIRSGSYEKRTYWSPSAVASSSPISDVNEAADAIRNVAASCIQAWARCFDSIILNLSGGLDSSIVLGCITNRTPRPIVTCITHYSKGLTSDERPYAYLAAQKAQVRLIDRKRNSDLNLQDMLSIQASPVPEGYVRSLENSRLEARLAREHGASAIFSGTYGDELFFFSISHALADLTRDRGFNRPMFDLAVRVAHLEGATVWRTLRRAVHLARTPVALNPLNDAAKNRPLVTRSVVDAAIRYADQNILSADPLNLGPGKLWQIFTLTLPLDCYDAFTQEDDAESLSPLLSQPLLETCLRIPTYLLTFGGQDRGLARLAFKELVPQEILSRISKGDMEDHAMEILSRNRRFVRQLLLEGVLAEQGLINISATDAALSEHPSAVMKGMAEIFRHIGTEVWLRQFVKPHKLEAIQAA